MLLLHFMMLALADIGLSEYNDNISHTNHIIAGAGSVIKQHMSVLFWSMAWLSCCFCRRLRGTWLGSILSAWIASSAVVLADCRCCTTHHETHHPDCTSMDPV